mmetsp:Transcript_80702/g.184952  ORF Transcript_80702/g.184952 Transcript_80702/m.184952 type:complete len:206 (+) Transcript_80702:561-1178(+)
MGAMLGLHGPHGTGCRGPGGAAGTASNRPHHRIPARTTMTLVKRDHPLGVLGACSDCCSHQVQLAVSHQLLIGILHFEDHIRHGVHPDSTIAVLQVVLQESPLPNSELQHSVAQRALAAHCLEKHPQTGCGRERILQHVIQDYFESVPTPGRVRLRGILNGIREALNALLHAHELLGVCHRPLVQPIDRVKTSQAHPPRVDQNDD